MRDSFHATDDISAAREMGLVAPGAVIQIYPDDPVFGVCLAIVTRTTACSLEAYIPLPRGERACVRLGVDKYFGVGWSEWGLEESEWGESTMKIDGDGQAFPHGDETHGVCDGMTLRMWLAGQALNGLLVNCDDRDKTARDYAYDALGYADELIARSKE